MISLAVDAVVFGYTSKEGLSVLLIQRKVEPFKLEWALPGGFVKENESLDEAVSRELQEETGASINYLEQLYTFGGPKRDPRNRVVSVAYYGLVRPDVFHLLADTDAADAKWHNLEELPDLAFDHFEILEMARMRLKGKITYEPIGFELLDKKFPFSELEKLYQTVLDKPLDRRNFKKKIMSYDFLEETSEKQVLKGAGRPGNLFMFNEEKYLHHKKKGINIDL